MAPKLGSLSFISQKTAILLFCLLKHVALTQRSVRRKVVLFPALLHGKRFLSSLQRATLLFSWLYSKERFFLWLAKWQRFASFWPGYAVFSIIFVRTANKPKHVICTIKLNPTRSTNEKAKTLFCHVKLKAARFSCQHTENVFSLLWDSKKGIPKRKTKSLFFVTKFSKHLISLPTRQNMFSIR